MNATLGGFDIIRQARTSLTLVGPARLIAALGRHWAEARTLHVLDSLAPHQRRDVFGDPAPSAIGPRVDADPHAVRMLMHVGR